MKVATPITPSSYQSIRRLLPQEQPAKDQVDTLERPLRIKYHTSCGLFLIGLFVIAFAVWTTSLSSNEHRTKESSGSTTIKDLQLLQSSHHTSKLKQQHEKKTKEEHQQDPPIAKPPHHLSSRAVIAPPRDDMLIFMDAKMNEYHPDTNPDGKLILLVAENRLLYPELSQKFQDIRTQNTTIPEWVFDYNDMRGHVDFQKAMAQMMESSWMAGTAVRPDSLVFASGAGAMLDALSWALAEAKEGVLVTGPIYAAFPADFGIHGKLHMEIIPTFPETNYEPTIDDLDRAYAASEAAGYMPRILLICQPHNPTGAVYTRQAMQEMITWALRKNPDMHVVSDEIYRNSVFPGVHVTSAAEIMWDLDPHHRNETHFLGDRVHIVAGLSKDWGASGMRVGSLMTHNTALYETMGTLSYYNGVSQLTQWAFTQLLEDTEWRDWYLAENQKRIHDNFVAAKEALARIDVPVFEGTKGTLFAWADFSSYLRPNQTERELWMELYERANVLFTLGESFHGEKPGMFRIVHTWPHGGVEAMQEMGRRLVEWKSNRDL